MKPNYVPAYDGLRFFLLLAVLEYHYMLHNVPIQKFWVLAFALPCFFVMSGFLITQLLLKIQNEPLGYALLKFYTRRALRIFPAYYVVLFCVVIFRGIPDVAWYASYLINFKIFYISAFGSSEEIKFYTANWDVNGLHLWSMAIEEQFYLLYPPVLLFFFKKWRTLFLVAAILGCLALRLWYVIYYPGICYGALLPISGEYILWGCLFAWLDHQGHLKVLRGHWALAGATLGFFFFCWLERYPQRYELGIMIPGIYLTAYAICISTFLLVLKHNKQAWYSRFLAFKPFTAIGKISYSAYLIHIFLNPLIDRIILAYPALIIFDQSPRALVGPVVTISVAAFMWWTFEARINASKDTLSARIDRMARKSENLDAVALDNC